MKKLILTLASNLQDLKKSVISKVSEKSDWENILIVPDRFSLLCELGIFEINQLDCIFNTKVLPVTRFASNLLERINIKFDRVSPDEESAEVRFHKGNEVFSLNQYPSQHKGNFFWILYFQIIAVYPFTYIYYSFRF